MLKHVLALIVLALAHARCSIEEGEDYEPVSLDTESRQRIMERIESDHSGRPT